MYEDIYQVIHQMSNQQKFQPNWSMHVCTMIVLVHIQPFKNTYFLAVYYFKVLEKYVPGVSSSQPLIQLKHIDLSF